MRKLFAVLFMLFCHLAWAQKTGSTTISGGPAGGACPVTVGTLFLNPVLTRLNGIAPLLVFVDSTGTTDSATLPGQNNTFQDVNYSINFGDAQASGTNKWAYGSNPGNNLMNLATGPIAAHVYYLPDGAGDTPVTITVTANDGTNTASCTLLLTVYDPHGANGFATNVCQSPANNFTGCPSGATHSTSAVANANTSSAMANKRVLFHCGETFTGSMSLGGTKWSVGAYGTCVNASPTSQGGRPIVSNISQSNATTDGRIADLDLEGTGSGYGFQLATLNTTVPSQLTMVNLYMNNFLQMFYWVTGNQIALVNSFTGLSTSALQPNYFNYGGHNCAAGILLPTPPDVYGCSDSSFNFLNIKYSMAIMGDHFSGGANSETVRMPASRFSVFTNSDYLKAGTAPGVAVFKFHSENTWTSSAVWIGEWTEDDEISDNYFSTSAGWPVEIAPQNANYDERIRFIIFERNSTNPTNVTTHLSLSANNFTGRNNVCAFGGACISFGNRGIEGGTTGGAPSMVMSNFGEFYNNSGSGTSSIVTFDGSIKAGTNSFVRNNLAFGGSVASGTTGTNIISNNSPNTALNPNFTNASGTLNFTTDFKPTANFTGATTVPAFSDALGVTRPPFDLGAVQH